MPEQKLISVDKLIPYENNPRKNDHVVEQIASAIKRFGFRVPVLAKSDGLVIDGHLRIKAAKSLGLAEVPVILCDDLSDAEVKALRVSINRMADLAEWDTELLTAELKDLDLEGFEIGSVGFTDDDLTKLGISLDADETLNDLLEGGDRGLTPRDREERYENSTIRQIVLIMDVDEFAEAIKALDAIKERCGVTSNTEAAMLAIKHYANHNA